MAEDQVVYDDVGPNLTRNMLIMRVGEPVDVDTWWGGMKAEDRPRASIFEFELGEQVKRHYLRIQWRSRELISIPLGDYRLKIPDWKPTNLVSDGTGAAAVVWWLEARETVAGALRSAAEMYWAEMQAWPCLGMVWPGTSNGEIKLGDGRMRVQSAKWVSAGCVVVL